MKTIKTRRPFNMVTFGATRSALAGAANFLRGMDEPEVAGFLKELRAELDAIERREWTPLFAQVVRALPDPVGQYAIGRMMGHDDGMAPDPQDWPE